MTLALLEDVLDAVGGARAIRQCVVVSPDSEALRTARRYSAAVVEEPEEGGVNASVLRGTLWARRQEASATLVLPGDLPLLQPVDLEMLVESHARTARVVMTPSLRLDGTNALLRRPPEVIPTSYDQDSFFTHLRAALDAALPTALALFPRIRFDVDTPTDLHSLRKTRAPSRARRTLEAVLHQRYRLARA